MTEYELHLGDCRDVLPGIVAADAVITDAPYEEHMHAAREKNSLRRTDGRRSRGALGFASIGELRPYLCAEVARMCAGWFLVFSTPEGVAAWRDAIEAAGMRYKRACVWVKPDAAPQFNGQGPAMGAEMVVAAWVGRGPSRWNGGGRRGVFTHPTNPRDRHGLHPTEKPVSLMRELVSLFTSPGDLVVDPLMGTGATGVACALLGRRFLGAEIDPEYFGAASARIAAAARAGSFTRPGPRRPRPRFFQ